MTVKLTLSQVETLRLVRRGVNSSPPLYFPNVQALVRKGYIEEFRFNGSVRYRETEKGKTFP